MFLGCPKSRQVRFSDSTVFCFYLVAKVKNKYLVVVVAAVVVLFDAGDGKLLPGFPDLVHVGVVFHLHLLQSFLLFVTFDIRHVLQM